MNFGILISVIISALLFSVFVSADQTFLIKPDNNDPYSIMISGLPPSSPELSVLKETYNFGDGFVSNKDSPHHNYKKSGTYTVSLTTMLKDTDENLYYTTTSVKVVIPFRNLTSNITKYPTNILPSPLPSPVNRTIPTFIIQQTDPFYDIPYLGFSTLPVVRIPKDTQDPFPNIPYLGGIYR